MPKLLCRLSQMPEDERLDICELLDDADIQYYETSAGFWGIGVAGLWLSDAGQYDEAQSMFDDYQHKRQELASQQSQKLAQQGFIVGLLTAFFHKPILSTITLLICLLILFLSVYPFML